MTQSGQQPTDGNIFDNFHTYLGREGDEDMNIAERKRKALDTGIDPQETSLMHILVHNGLCMMKLHPEHEIYKALFPRLLGALEKADEEDGSLPDKVFLFLSEAGAQIEVEHNSPQPEGSVLADEEAVSKFGRPLSVIRSSRADASC